VPEDGKTVEWSKSRFGLNLKLLINYMILLLIVGRFEKDSALMQGRKQIYLWMEVVFRMSEC
jgi:hypothetical protein